ncbi:MAG: amino acid deaminase/aldolase [Saprospiraceae bacterium]|nr:amino acid deaminase/aldolase [Saprospiraceae bacterium]
MIPDYSYYQKVLQKEEFPLAYVDLNLLDQNIKDILARAQEKKIRLASKSIRCRHILEYLLDYNQQFQGIMCFTAPEAVWLARAGFDDLLIAYPSYQKAHLEAVGQAVKKGKKIYLMVDRIEHLQRLQELGKNAKCTFLVCLDLDMSSRYPSIHFGVHRSSVNDLPSTETFVRYLKQCSHVSLKGVMGYEAQIAGLGDNMKGKWLMNRIIRFLKKRSIKEISQRRAEVVEYLYSQEYDLHFVNGGGTGSLETTREEAVVSEITVGSGFYSPCLFDEYSNFKHQPAAGFAIEIVRKPSNHIYTCLGGGYVASGMADINKVPQPYLPKGCKLDQNEMAGEVQTPIHYSGNTPLAIGDIILMRHSKAGELCERFNHLHLVRNGQITNKVFTYRGEGKCFL